MPTVGGVSNASSKAVNGVNSLVNNNVKKVSKKVKTLKNVNSLYEDTEGLLTTLSVIAALMLTLQVTVFSTVLYDEWRLNEYRTCLMYSKACRHFVAKKLSKDEVFMRAHNEVDMTPVECYGDSNNLTCDSTDKTNIFNVIDTLLTSKDPYTIWPSAGSSYDESLADVDRAFKLTKNYIDQEEIMIYKDMHLNSFIQARLVGSYANGAATMLFTSTFAGSLFLYTALSLSDARINSQRTALNKSLTNFNKVALPVIFFLYLQLLFGVMIFFYGVASLMQFKNPAWTATVDWTIIWQAGFLLPSIAALIAMSFRAWKAATDLTKTDGKG
jgi:hypothetical protein